MLIIGKPRLNTFLFNKLVAGLFTLLIVAFSTSAKTSEINVEHLSAAFIYQITKYTTWPEQAANLNNTVDICIYGSVNDEFNKYLKMIESKTTRKKAIKVYGIDDFDAGCHIIFSTSSQWENVSKNQLALWSKSTLLISTSKSFLSKGGMLALVPQDRKINIFYSIDSVSKSQVKLDSRLKSLATGI